MKILFVTQYFYPETFKGNDIAFDWAARGLDVTVLTGIPNYPEGVFYKGFGLFKNSKEVINGVTVIRVPIVPRGKGNKIQLMLNYFSYAFVGSIYAFFLALFNRYDRIFVQQLSPVTLALPGVVAKKLLRKPLDLWVLDLWPESLTAAGGVNNKYVLGFFDSIVKFIYKNSDRILISSKGFHSSVIEKYAEANIEYFPNWAEDVFSSSYNSPRQDKINNESTFKIMFAGNMGEAQNLEHVLKAAKYTQNINVEWLFVGDGRKKDWVENYIKSEKLEASVKLLGRHPIESMPSFFYKADVMLVSLKDELIFNLTAPAKIQAYMAASKPILGLLNGEGANLILESGSGFVANANNPEDLAEVVRLLSQTRRGVLNEMGRSGLMYYEKHFEKSKCLDRLFSLINDRI